MLPFDARTPPVAQTSAKKVDPAGINVLTWPILDGTPIAALTTTRHGGVSTGTYDSLNLALHVGDDAASVLENRRRATRALDASLDDLVLGQQVHGNQVAVVGGAERGRGAFGLDDAIAGVDALVTTIPGVVLATLVADCVPVVLADPFTSVLACVHAGWRGALSGVLEKTLDAMTAIGAGLDRILAGVGPAIAGDRYEVGEEVAVAAHQHLGDPGPLLWPGRPGHFHLDLAGTIRTVLLRAGLSSDHVAVAAIDTGPPGPFFSARSEPGCGRFGLFARIQP